MIWKFSILSWKVGKGFGGAGAEGREGIRGREGYI